MAHTQNSRFAGKWAGYTQEELIAGYQNISTPEAEKLWLRNAVLMSVYGLVIYTVTRRVRNTWIPRWDAIQNTLLEVSKAVDSFDPARGKSFVNYLPWFISAGISLTLRSSYNFRLPDKIRQYRRNGAGSINIADLKNMVDMNADCAEAVVYTREITAILHSFFSHEKSVLTHAEKLVLSAAYGIDGRNEMKMSEIADLLARHKIGASNANITRIKQSGIAKLKRALAGV